MVSSKINSFMILLHFKMLLILLHFMMTFSVFFVISCYLHSFTMHSFKEIHSFIHSFILSFIHSFLHSSLTWHFLQVQKSSSLAACSQ